MLEKILGIDNLENFEIKQIERAKYFKKFIEEKSEYLQEIREHYRFHAFSVDFGDQAIELEYTSGRYMKCADSDGKVYFQRVIPEEIPSEDLVEIVDQLFKTETLSSFLEILEFPDWRELSFLVSSKDSKSQAPRNIREFLRECLEWSVLLNYARSNKRLILLKDGLLRNKIFKRVANNPDCAYIKLQNAIETICKSNENLIIGIAKSSKLLRQVNKFLGETSIFKSQKSFVIPIENDHEIMKISYTFDLYREGEIVFGDYLYLTRFKPNLSADIFTVEIPDFAEKNWEGVPNARRKLFSNRSYAYITALIGGLPQRTLPGRFNGAPEPLAKAHEYAHTKEVEAVGIQRKIRQNMLNKDYKND